MPRTSVTISYRDPLSAKKTIERILTQNGYARGVLNNEFVWKGTGMKNGMCAKIEFTPNSSVILYAWFYSILTSDQDLSGMMGMAPKQQAMKMLQQIQQEISKQ